MRIEEILSQKQLLDYTKANPPEVGGLEALFPNQTVYDLKAEFVKGANNKEVVAQFYSFDTPTEIGQREGFEKGEVSLYLIKEKMKLDERELMHLRHPRSDAEVMQIVRSVYNDVERIRKRIENRIDLMRYEVFQTGKLTIEGNGLKELIDFQAPANHFGDLDWNNPTADIFEDIFKISDLMLKDTGFRPRHITVSPSVLQNIIRNESVRTILLGTEAMKLITIPELNAELTRVGLPTFNVDDRMYATEKVIRKQRVLTNEFFFNPNSIIFTPDGALGNTLRGPVPEAEIAGYTGASTESAGSVFLTHYQDVDPVAEYVKGSATAMVTFPHAEQVYFGKLKQD